MNAFSPVLLLAMLSIAACSSTSQDLGNDDPNEGGGSSSSSSGAAEPTQPVDEDAGTSSSSSGDAASPPPSHPGAKRMFVTSVGYAGNLAELGGAETGLEGADSLCNQHAVAAGLGGTWVAWLSSSTEDAFDRVPDVGPWYTVDTTTVIFANKLSMPNGPEVDVILDESGKDPGGFRSPVVWTATNDHGRYDVKPRESAGQTVQLDGCLDWTTDDASSRASIGWANYPNIWTEQLTLDGYDACSANNRLYCFEK
jgi:hypothetical protein